MAKLTNKQVQSLQNKLFALDNRAVKLLSRIENKRDALYKRVDKELSKCKEALLIEQLYKQMDSLEKKLERHFNEI